MAWVYAIVGKINQLFRPVVEIANRLVEPVIIADAFENLTRAVHWSPLSVVTVRIVGIVHG